MGKPVVRGCWSASPHVACHANWLPHRDDTLTAFLLKEAEGGEGEEEEFKQDERRKKVSSGSSSSTSEAGGSSAGGELFSQRATLFRFREWKERG